MKFPEKFQGRHRIRDMAICNLYLNENKSSDELGGMFKLTGRRIRAILYQNREFLQLDRRWEKTKQIWRIKRQISKRPDSTKDVADLEKLLHEVMEEKQALIDQSHHHVIQIINYGKKNLIGENTSSDRFIPAP